MQELPLGAKPYLCVSQDMDVTPLSRKSNVSMGKPDFVRKGRRKEPRHASTWKGMRRRRAMRDRPVRSSIMPWGKLGAEPTI